MHGRSVGRVVVYRDVTQRVQFEQKLMFNREVVEASGPMIWVDYQGEQVTYANPAACELLGYAADEIVGVAIGALDMLYSRAALKPLDDELRRSGKPVPFRPLTAVRMAPPATSTRRLP
jgi:PAS domain-containing protein